MLEKEESEWIQSTANELNNLLQVISESSQVLETIYGGNADTDRFFAILRSGVERATKTARVMVNRVGGSSEEGFSAVTAAPAAKLTVMQPPPAAPAGSVPADVLIHNPMGTRELVLIVDDEDFITMLAQRVLADEGYRVVTAKDGFGAIETYRKLRDQIALVILDFTMPVMDGADVFEELLLINPQVPVVLSSGFAEQERLRTMLARGLRGFIPKPYTQQKLLTQIRSTLDALHAERTGERRVL